MQGITTADALGRYLDLAADQMKLTAGNMANIDTPGYKTQGFDFEAEFAAAVKGDPSHAGGTGMNGAQGGMREKVGDVDGLVARPDGNTVSIDRESLQLAKSQLEFRTGVALLRSEYSRMMSAIHADSK